MSEFGGTRDRVSAYFNVNLGKISKSLGKQEPEDMAGVTKRMNKNGDTVYEIILDYLAGKIVKVELKDPEDGKEDFGSQMVFTLEAESGNKCILNCKFDSAYGRGFMFSLPNVDLDQPVEFEPYKYFSKKKGRDITGLNLYQNGKKLDWAYGTRDNTDGMPELEEVTFKGKKSWDNTKQLEFLTDRFEKFTQTVERMQAAEPVPAEAMADEVEDEDPF